MRILNRRVLAYGVSLWMGSDGRWYAWAESPQGIHLFCQAGSLPALNALTFSIIQDHLAQQRSN